MNDNLENINALLPDNQEALISPEDMRDCFEYAFLEIKGKISFNNQTISAPDTDFKYVMLLNDQGVNKMMLAGEVGKNVANSRPTTTVDGGLDFGADWSIDTKGYNYSVKGLADKSSDNTYNRIRVQNSEGKDAVSNGKEILIAMPSNLTEAEKTDWKTAMNGGWTTNTMSVAFMMPFMVDNSDNETWVLLKGANLNFNPAGNFSVKIFDESGTVLKDVVDNSQVQLYSNGIDLMFYYNFSSLGIGKYKVELFNGVASYMTTTNIEVVGVLNSMPYVQGEIRLVSGSSDLNVALPNGVILKPDPNIKALVDNSHMVDLVACWVDGNELKGTEDWWVTLRLETNVTSNYAVLVAIANLGLAPYSSDGLIAPVYGLIDILNSPTGHSYIQYSDVEIIGGGHLKDSANGSLIHFIKKGNSLQCLIVGLNNTYIIKNYVIDTSMDYRLISNVNNQLVENRKHGVKFTKLRMAKL